MTHSNGRRGRGRRGLVLAIGLALSTLGAACTPELEEAADAPEGDAGPSFSDEQQLLDWMAEQVEQVPLPSARVYRDDSGRVLYVDMGEVEDRTKLAALLGGAAGYFTLAGKREPVEALVTGKPARGSQTSDGVETLDQAVTTSLCDPRGTFCTNNESWNTHFGIGWLSYHSVGARTAITRGGYVENYYQPFPDPNWRCGGSGRCNGGAPTICRPGDYKVNNNRAGIQCRHVEGESFASVSVAWFSNNQIVRQGTRTARNGGVELSMTGGGALKGTCNSVGPGNHVLHQPVECEINGVCAAHFAEGTGGSTMTTTGAGSHMGCPFRSQPPR